MKAVCLSAMCTLRNSPSLICYEHCLCFRRLIITKKKSCKALSFEVNSFICTISLLYLRSVFSLELQEYIS